MKDWQVLGGQVTSQIAAVDEGTAVAFAAVTAERLMRLDPQRRPFTASLRPLLDLVWRAAAGDQAAYKPIAAALGQFYTGEYCHNDGQDGPDDADDDPAAAILYAAECYLHGMRDFAALVARRAIDAADYRTALASGSSGDDEASFEAESEAAMAAEVPTHRWPRATCADRIRSRRMGPTRRKRTGPCTHTAKRSGALFGSGPLPCVPP